MESPNRGLHLRICCDSLPIFPARYYFDKCVNVSVKNCMRFIDYWDLYISVAYCKLSL